MLKYKIFLTNKIYIKNITINYNVVAVLLIFFYFEMATKDFAKDFAKAFFV
jgi:hypothetical protein